MEETTEYPTTYQPGFEPHPILRKIQSALRTVCFWIDYHIAYQEWPKYMTLQTYDSSGKHKVRSDMQPGHRFCQEEPNPCACGDEDCDDCLDWEENCLPMYMVVVKHEGIDMIAKTRSVWGVIVKDLGLDFKGKKIWKQYQKRWLSHED